MKVIFSRKGFDSQYGGMPSPILPDGRLIALPIPSNHDQLSMETLGLLDDAAMDRILRDLSQGRHDLQTRVHFDPDLGGRHSTRLAGWRPALGQTGSAQAHLSRHAVGKGDVFLFFGWFRLAEHVAGAWRFVREAPDLHVVFGWLEVDDVLSIVPHRDDALRRYPWIASHPHIAAPEWYTDERNTLYVSRIRSSYAPSAPYGGGRFPKLTPMLQLTRPGHSRSVWSLPRWFAPEGREPMSYHRNAGRWEIQGDEAILRSVAKGQEFVIDGAVYPELESWIQSLIAEGARD